MTKETITYSVEKTYRLEPGQFIYQKPRDVRTYALLRNDTDLVGYIDKATDAKLILSLLDRAELLKKA